MEIYSRWEAIHLDICIIRTQTIFTIETLLYFPANAQILEVFTSRLLPL